MAGVAAAAAAAANPPKNKAHACISSMIFDLVWEGEGVKHAVGGFQFESITCFFGDVEGQMMFETYMVTEVL